MAKRVFPAILKKRPSEDSLRIWVPGCATGEEAYSIAIRLTEFMEHSGTNVPIQIFATDVSETAIQKARAGTYEMSALAEVSQERLKRFFVKSNGGYQESASLREALHLSRVVWRVNKSRRTITVWNLAWQLQAAVFWTDDAVESLWNARFTDRRTIGVAKPTFRY